MMIRGIEGVILPTEVELGAFYLDPGFGKGTTLFQVVRTGDIREGRPVEAMLVYATEESEMRPDLLSLQPLEGFRPVIKMPPVSVRVDPPSATGTGSTAMLRGGALVIDGTNPIITAFRAYAGWTAISLETGSVVRPSNNWVSFARWSLVVDEAGEEIVIATFGES